MNCSDTHLDNTQRRTSVYLAIKLAVIAACLFSGVMAYAQPGPPVVVCFRDGAFYYNYYYDSTKTEIQGFNGFTKDNFFVHHSKDPEPDFTGNKNHILYLRDHNTWFDGKKWGLYDWKNDTKHPCAYDILFPLRPCNQKETGRTAGFMAFKNGKWGLISTSGKELIPCKYDLPFTDEANGDCFYSSTGKTCTSDELHKELECLQVMLESGTFTFPLLKGSLVLVQNGKFGLVDTLGGNVLIPFNYESMHYHYGGLIEMRKGKKTFWGTRYGKILEGYSDVLVSNSGIHNVKKNGKWGYIDNKGKEIVPCQFTAESDMGKNPQTGACSASAPVGEAWWEVVVWPNGEVQLKKQE